MISALVFRPGACIRKADTKHSDNTYGNYFSYGLLEIGGFNPHINLSSYRPGVNSVSFSLHVLSGVCAFGYSARLVISIYMISHIHSS